MRGRIRTALLLSALGAVALASSSTGQGPPGGSPPGLAVANAVKERNAQRLLDKPGVVGVGVGVNRAGKAVIEIYKEKDDVADVPSSLEGVDVESVVTGIIEARAPTDRFPRPVPIGVSSGLAGVATGTLGARVTDGTNVYALSNNHVFAGINTASIGDPIIQPGDVDGGSDPGDRIGTLYTYQTIDFNGGNNTMDAALALTTAANTGTATPSDGYGTPSNVTTTATIGMAVQKYGRTTGFQLGSVAATNVSVDVCYLVIFDFCLQEARFVDQISVSPGAFSAPGDSGSLIVTQGGNEPVALLFAGGDGLTIGTPIDLVLQRFGVTIDGRPPGDGPPGAPMGLSAVAGDASATLSWTAPSFDGGSPVTGYRVYRGTTAGGETFLESVGTGTSFVDSDVANGQTYYYKVSAESALGEGPLSGEVSVTPAVLVPPVDPLPVLDDFNRPDETLSAAGLWANGLAGSGETGLNVASNQLACSRTSTCTAWRSTALYGADVEVSARVAALPGAGNHIRLVARLQQPGTAGYDGYMLRTNQLAGPDEVYLERIDDGAIVRLLTTTRELAVGDRVLLRTKGSTIEAWHHDGTTWSRLGTVADTRYGGPGYIGVGLRGTTGRLDDFGAPAASVSPPGAPTGLTALGGDGSATLAWSAPSFNGGAAVTGYRVYRGTTAGGETFLQAVGAVTSFTDTGLANDSTYYYKVSAQNVAGEGPLSNEASATPTSVVPPSEPLAVVDDFNRANETLSDGGRWRNGVAGSGETGLNVTSSQLACSRSTTCTAWRGNPLYGPDVEVSTRVTVLPGAGNSVRLKARLQQPGTSGYDGYMLRTSQLSGPDEIYLERIDNGAIVRLRTVTRELAVGDTLLLRVEGAALEAWVKSGSSWLRVATATDATYAAPGSVGMGLRGTVARVDDFGARSTSLSAPGAPTGLTATAGDGAASLVWTAPVFDGGSAITGYRIYRGTSSGGETFLQGVGSVTTFADSGLTNGQTYYYKVSAENAVGESQLSSEASATPSGIVLPTEPLVVLDDFDRPNESPLSGGGAWGTGANGSGERCLKVVSNQLASNKSTTCTSFRSGTQYGPDVEVSARVSTLPGSGNHVRLKGRLQQPGTSGYDGYMLRTNQLAGTDELYLERIDNGAILRLRTATKELAAGDTLLLRIRGSSLEAWVKSGGAWTLVTSVVDTRYAGAGYVGVGLRGTSGRLDDFGARALP